MKLITAYQKLKILEPTFTTRDAAKILELSIAHSSMVLNRLTKQDIIVPLARGRWAYSQDVDPLLLPNILAYPMMAYISLYSALYFHGMIDQIPETVFAISNGKTKIFHTPLAKVSIHNIKSVLFTDYESHGKHGLLMATPEKALFDTLYLMPAKSNIFKRLTEVELPEKFQVSKFDKWLRHVKHEGRKLLIQNNLNYLVMHNNI